MGVDGGYAWMKWNGSCEPDSLFFLVLPSFVFFLHVLPFVFSLHRIVFSLDPDPVSQSCLTVFTPVFLNPAPVSAPFWFPSVPNLYLSVSCLCLGRQHPNTKRRGSSQEGKEFAVRVRASCV